MKLDLREKDHVSILILSDQLTGGGGDEQFREAIDTLLDLVLPPSTVTQAA